MKRLTPEERLRLLEEIWTSFSDTPESVALTDGQRKELDRRLDELDGDSARGIPWDEVLQRIRQRIG